MSQLNEAEIEDYASFAKVGCRVVSSRIVRNVDHIDVELDHDVGELDQQIREEHSSPLVSDQDDENFSLNDHHESSSDEIVDDAIANKSNRRGKALVYEKQEDFAELTKMIKSISNDQYLNCR